MVVDTLSVMRGLPKSKTSEIKAAALEPLEPRLLLSGGHPIPPGNEGDNIALGKSYVVSATPNYPYCSDDEYSTPENNDMTQLTDGLHATGYFWTQDETVGWMWQPTPVDITIDLGEVQPIKGVSYSTAGGGGGGAHWETALDVEVSNDGVHFYQVADLVDLDPPPGNETYATHTYDVNNLATFGRYVRFTATRSPFVFVDEIEIYRGADSLLGDNVAEGASYTMSVAPNYSLTTDAGDATQLTDGLYASTGQSMWSQQAAVGWMHKTTPVAVTMDLGTIQPIQGVSFHTTASESSEVTWPQVVNVLVSDDGVNFYDAGELTSLSIEHGLPDPTPSPYINHTYWTDRLNTHGRYVKIVAQNNPYLFVDEIEVYRGHDAMLALPFEGDAISDLSSFMANSRDRALAARRIVLDAQTLQQQVAATPSLTQEQRDGLNDSIDSVVQQAMYLPAVDPATFHVTLPMNSLHEQLFGVQAQLWQYQGHEPLTAWTTPLWDQLTLFQSPETTPASLSVAMMQNEYRSAAFNLSNATDSDMTVTLNFEDLPDGVNPAYIKVQQVEWTDTTIGAPIAAALPDAAMGPNGYLIDIPAGMTRQVWLTFNPVTTNPGTYNGTIVIDGGAAGGTLDVPLTFRLSSLAMSEDQELGLGGWDYTDILYSEITSENVDDVTNYLFDYFMDTPWATRAVMPLVANPTDFSAFDAWVASEAGASNYGVFLNVGTSFAGYAMGTQAFNDAVGSWISAFATHWQSIGIDPSQICLNLVDEPRTASQADQITAWAAAIQAANTGVQIWVDPTFSDPWNYTAMFDVCDIVCVHRPKFLIAGATYQNFYRGLAAAGKTLNFYSCIGTTDRYDPYTYNMLQAWTAWQEGATSMYFWSFADQGDANSWRTDYNLNQNFLPYFLEPDSVTSGKGMEAIRQGVEDYQYLAMLRDRIDELEAAGVPASELTAAQTLLDSAPGLVLGATNASDLLWAHDKDRSVADQVRLDILDMLESLAPQTGDNIALGKSYTFNMPPNYVYCTDAGDATQLTDGQHTTSGTFWTQQSTVGWAYPSSPVEITIDLGSVQPISGVSYSTAGGVSDVNWAASIDVQVSKDGVNFTSVADLAQLDPAPAYGAYALHTYDTDTLSAFGRYVRFETTLSPFAFVDEIEIRRGADALVGQNIALGASYTMSAAPNYDYSTDAGDATQLTDGQYSAGLFWTQLSTVGWKYQPSPVEITIDLGLVQPISGVSFSTAGGVSGVNWATSIDVQVSTDGVNFTSLADLVQLDPAPAYGTYATHVYDTDTLSALGRYVRFEITQSPFVFVDEIEIYRGMDAPLA